MIIRRDSVPPFDFDGVLIRDYTAGLDTTASFATIEVPAGAEHAEAWSRRSDKYYYVLAGTVEFTDSGEVHDLATGDFCLVRKEEHFSYRNSSGGSATLCLVHAPTFDLESEEFA